MTIDEIRADVAHCLSVEGKDDPCFHCRQKLFLLEYIDGQAKDADGLNGLLTKFARAGGLIPGEKIDIDALDGA